MSDLQDLLDVLDFLRLRDTARRVRSNPRCYGVSSDALAAFALGWAPRPLAPGRPQNQSPYGTVWIGDEMGIDYPHDEDDLAACELTYQMAPARIQERMLPVLEEFRAWVRQGVNRYGEAPR